MNPKFRQILALNGIYFVVTSALQQIDGIFYSLTAFAYPFFLLLCIIISIIKLSTKWQKLSQSCPKFVLLLNTIGAYTICSFTTNLIGIIVPTVVAYSDLLNLLILLIFTLIFFFQLFTLKASQWLNHNSKPAYFIWHTLHWQGNLCSFWLTCWQSNITSWQIMLIGGQISRRFPPMPHQNPLKLGNILMLASLLLCVLFHLFIMLIWY